MAQQTTVVLIDDIDGGPAAETVQFSLDGADFEIDLSSDNAELLRATLADYTDKARRTGRKKTTQRIARTRQPAPKVDGAAIREWARANGHNVPARGRISADIIRLYEEDAVA